MQQTTDTKETESIYRKPTEDELQYLQILEEQYAYLSHNKIECFYRDEGILVDGHYYPPRRDYKRYLQFFAAGIYNDFRALFSGNRVGKTESLCGYETVLHLTGRYPKWWRGHRYHYPIKAGLCGHSSEQLRDVIQAILIGERGCWGTGLIRKEDIADYIMGSGGTGAVSKLYLKYKGDENRLSVATFRAYEQGRKAAEGLNLDWLWIDEEPGSDFYGEATTRIFSKKGKVVVSFTPLDGYTDTVRTILPPSGIVPPYDPNLYKKEVDEMINYKGNAW